MKKIFTLLIVFSFISPVFATQKLTKKAIHAKILELEKSGILDKESAQKAYKKLEAMTEEELLKLEEAAHKVINKK